LRVLAEELGVSGRNDLLEKTAGAAPVKTVAAFRMRTLARPSQA